MAASGALVDTGAMLLSLPRRLIGITEKGIRLPHPRIPRIPAILDVGCNHKLSILTIDDRRSRAIIRRPRIP